MNKLFKKMSKLKIMITPVLLYDLDEEHERYMLVL